MEKKYIKKIIEEQKEQIKKLNKVTKDIEKIKNKVVNDPYHFVKDTAHDFNMRVRSKIGGAVVAAFALIIALVWKDAIQQIVDNIIRSIGITGTTHIYQIILAMITTVICVLGILYFSKWGEEKKKKG